MNRDISIFDKIYTQTKVKQHHIFFSMERQINRNSYI